MSAEEINKYLDIYENYIKDLIRLNGDNLNVYHCSTKTIKKQNDNYVIGNLWPRVNANSEECEQWPRVPNLDDEPDGLVYLCVYGLGYTINVFHPKWSDSVMIIGYSYEV